MGISDYRVHLGDNAQMTKVIAYMALHYGKDYLASAIRSVIDHVDEYHAIYTPVGSHGHRTTVPCPETRDELFAIAAQAAGSKLRWHEGTWPYEGAQRDSIHQYVPDADVIIVLDADEIWPVKVIETVIGLPAKNAPVTEIRIAMIHFWRSFYRCVLHDPAWPIRVLYPKAKAIRSGVFALSESGSIAHMGYAQRPEIVRYKLETHGHKNEFRRDVNWFDDVYMTNRQTDCHPVGSEYWNPETVNPLDYMPAWMAEHPYYGMDVIE